MSAPEKITRYERRSHIHTLPKKGYRFEADVKVVKIGPAHRGLSTWLAGVGVISAIGLLIVLAWLFFYRTRQEPVAGPTGDGLVALTDGRQARRRRRMDERQPIFGSFDKSRLNVLSPG